MHLNQEIRLCSSLHYTEASTLKGTTSCSGHPMYSEQTTIE